MTKRKMGDMPLGIFNWVIRNLSVVLGTLLVGSLILLAILGYRTFLNAPREITATVILERIQALSELSTVRYNFSSIVTTTRDMPGLLSALYGENQAMVAVGHVRAGIDLGQLTEEDVIRGQDVLVIKLPSPALQDCFLSENDSYVVSRQTGIFARNTPDLDSSARSYALTQFRDAALSENILDEANARTKEVLEGFLTLISPENMRIDVVTIPPDPNVPFPQTCQ